MSRVGFLRFDISTKVLILANVITMIVALALHWSVIDVMWIYWSQSAVIGSIAIFRILLMKQVFVAGFFLFHYGIFHMVYFLFLYGEQTTPAVPVVGIASCSFIFLVNHVFSSWHNCKRDMKVKPEPGRLMLAPYARIIPMHLTIILRQRIRDISEHLSSLPCFKDRHGCYHAPGGTQRKTAGRRNGRSVGANLVFALIVGGSI